MLEVFLNFGFQCAIESFDDAGFDVFVLIKVKLYASFLKCYSKLFVDEFFALVCLQLERFSFFLCDNFAKHFDDSFGILCFESDGESIFGENVDEGRQITKAVALLSEVRHVCQIRLVKVVDAA